MANKRLFKGDFGSLDQLVIGQKALVTKLDTPNPALKRRLLDMGITTGAKLEVKKIAPLGDPVDILIRGYELCLRIDDMKMIGVSVIK